MTVINKKSHCTFNQRRLREGVLPIKLLKLSYHFLWYVRATNTYGVVALTSKMEVEDLLNRVGKRIFVKYYDDFKELAMKDIPNVLVVEKIHENFTQKSKNSRTAKAKRIFVEGKQIEALKVIVESNHPSVLSIKKRATELLQ